MIPNLLRKAKIPDILPRDMQIIVSELRESKNKEGCLKKAYDILIKKYTGCRIYERFFDLFITNIGRLWNKNGGLHCTNLNYLLRVLLVNSGFFKDDDIKPKFTAIRYVSLHQYLKMRLDKDKFVNVDPWGASHGIKFGDYAHGFNYKLF